MTSYFTSTRLSLYILPLLGGALYALGFPTKSGIYFFPLALVGFALLLNAWSLTDKKRTPTLKRQILSALCFSVGYNMTGYYWIPHTISEFGGILFPYNYILGQVFGLVIAPQLYVFIVIVWIINRLKFRSTPFVSDLNRRHFIFAALLTLCEYFTPQQFPAHLGHAWLQISPFLGLAPHFGAPIFSFISFWLCFSLISLLKYRYYDYIAWAATAIFCALNLLYPLSVIEQDADHKTNIRMVQANIGNVMKLSSEAGHVQSIGEVFERFYNLSTQNYSLSSLELDLIIWPETAYPYMMNSAEIRSDKEAIPQLLSDIIQETNAELFIGGYDRNPKAKHPRFESEYNSAFHFDKWGKLKDVYHKRILIPFGEGLPFGPLNGYISQYIQNISYFARGEHFVLFETERNTPFITAICYEILFSSFMRNYFNAIDQRPHFIINITNDSWYGDTSEPFQHLFLSKWRAVEFQTPIIRMTNTGITSVIYSDGSESERIGVFEKGVLDTVVRTQDRKPTLFQLWGIWGTVMLWPLFFLIIVLVDQVNSRQAKNLPLKGREGE